jgi:hypothetical protein
MISMDLYQPIKCLSINSWQVYRHAHHSVTILTRGTACNVGLIKGLVNHPVSRALDTYTIIGGAGEGPFDH